MSPTPNNGQFENKLADPNCYGHIPFANVALSIVLMEIWATDSWVINSCDRHWMSEWDAINGINIGSNIYDIYIVNYINIKSMTKWNLKQTKKKKHNQPTAKKYQTNIGRCEDTLCDCCEKKNNEQQMKRWKKNWNYLWLNYVTICVL